MAVLQKVRFLGNERLDLVDIENLQDFLADDYKVFNTCLFSPNSFIVKGFKILDVGGLDIDVTIAGGAVFNTASGGEFFVGESTASNLSQTLTDNAMNYIHVVVGSETLGSDARVFWDKTANNGEGAEFIQVIDTAEALNVSIFVTTGGFSAQAEHIPVGRVQTISGDIVSIHDHRNLLHRLARGQLKNPDYDFPWVSGRTEPPYTVNIASATGAFLTNEVITGGTSGTTATLQTGGTFSVEAYKLSGDFTIGETITGGTSGETATVTNYFESFDGADKSILGQKDLYDALATEIKQLKGTDYWFEQSDFSFKTFFQDLALTVISGGGTIQWSDSEFSSKVFTNTSSVVFNHGLGNKPLVQVLDNTNTVIGYDSISHGSVDQTTVTFGSNSNGKVLVAGGSSSKFASTTFTSQTSVVFNHSLGANPIIQILDNSDNVIEADSVVHNTVNQTTITFASAESGTVLALGDGGAEYATTSFTGQTTVTFNHNLGVLPLIQIIDNTDTVIEADSVVHNTINQVEVTFGSAQTGDIIAVGGSGQQLSWSSDINLRVIGESTTYTIPTSQSPLSVDDGQVIYIDIDEGGNRGVSGNRTFVVANRELVPIAGAPINGDIYWMAIRDANKLYFRGVKQELQPGEEVEIGDTISEDYLTYTGMTSETDNDPNYSSVTVVTQGDNLTTAIGKLDAESDSISTDLATHISDTTTHGTTGDIVGTTDTQTLSAKTLVLPKIADTSADHDYVFAVSELTADRIVTMPLLIANDTFVFEDHIQTLTNKTLTSPTIGDFTNATHNHTSNAEGGKLDHGLALNGLGDDDHPHYTLASGARAFTGTVSGITPTSASHLATKGYVDSVAGVSDHGALTGLSDDDHSAVYPGYAQTETISGTWTYTSQLQSQNGSSTGSSTNAIFNRYYCVSAWCQANASGTIVGNSADVSVVRNSLGDYTITYLNTKIYNQAVVINVNTTSGNAGGTAVDIISQSTSSVNFQIRRHSDTGGAFADEAFTFVKFGA